MKLKLVLATLILLANTTVMASEEQDAIDKAKISHKAATATGFEWTTMSALIKKAEKAAKDGNAKMAIKLANEVMKQSEAVIMQADTAKTAG